jgi:hypothetical protein
VAVACLALSAPATEAPSIDDTAAREGIWP